MNPLLLRGVRPYGEGEPVDVLVRDGVIAELAATIDAATIDADDVQVVDGNGAVLLPGFVDLHTHLREPGREDTETIATGSAAAALGGYTAVFAMIINTPYGNSGPRVDGYEIRTAAVARDIPCVTTIQGAAAAVHGIEAAIRGDIGVRPLQALQAALRGQA